MEQDKTGHSLFIVHSELGLNVIEQMNSENLITCCSINYSLYEKSQKFTIHRKSRINEDKENIDFELKLQSLKIYYDWATRNYANMKKHVWIMVHIVQPYFRAKKMNSKMIITKLYNKILRKLNNGKK